MRVDGESLGEIAEEYACQFIGRRAAGVSRDVALVYVVDCMSHELRDRSRFERLNALDALIDEIHKKEGV